MQGVGQCVRAVCGRSGSRGQVHHAERWREQHLSLPLEVRRGGGEGASGGARRMAADISRACARGGTHQRQLLQAKQVAGYPDAFGLSRAQKMPLPVANCCGPLKLDSVRVRRASRAFSSVCKGVYSVRCRTTAMDGTRPPVGQRGPATIVLGRPTCTRRT